MINCAEIMIFKERNKFKKNLEFKHWKEIQKNGNIWKIKYKSKQINEIINQR